ncbi:hypothetical protein PRVXH_002547 [Proteinivorax hydrogeniformans]|uniref:Uncharacterized protein n=1 Tax=Proteinivorax hydrogeniformans TaxID=1826727 RepID=A0AAU8HSM9_9FIRM
MKKALVTLNVSESKRLIAKSVAKLPQVKSAIKNGMIVIAGGTTNGYIAEELTGKKLNKELYTAGVVCQGRGCITPEEERIAPIVLDKGKISDLSWVEALDKLGKDDVFIKGGNAVDINNNVGIMVAHPQGGTIGAALGTVIARGVHLILPVGLEKLIPSVHQASLVGGIEEIDYSLGMPVGLVPVTTGQVISETEAINRLYDIEATPFAAGGIGASQGSISMLLKGEDTKVSQAFGDLKEIKGEKELKGTKQKCPCRRPCSYFK